MLGHKLHLRITRRVETTADGERLRAEAHRTLAGLRQVVDGFRRRADLARRTVTVAVTPMLAAMTLPPIIRSYAEHHPDVRIRLKDQRYVEGVERTWAAAIAMRLSVDSNPKEMAP
ncbi:MAG: LysR family transcriptional regulator [Lautropia sp.]|nr:LysR family transcriptional regulator [Lautropia sp.]